MRRYRIILSNTKDYIVIKDTELDKVLRGIQEGNPVMTGEGIFNPSYFVAIFPDYEREKVVAQGYHEPEPFKELIENGIIGIGSGKKGLKQIGE